MTIGGLVFTGLLLWSVCGLAQGSGTWNPTGSPGAGRSAATAASVNGMVLLAGGNDGSNNVLASAELYNPTTGAWTPTGSLNVARNTYLATALSNGKVLIAGGCTTSSCSAATRTAEIYDPTTGKWTMTGSMAGIHYYSAATLLPGGRVLVEGGCSLGNCNAITASAEVYNPGTGKWTLTGAMSTARDYHTATLMANGKVLVAGGFSGGNSVEIYDPAAGKWSSAAPMVYAHAQHAAVLLVNGSVLVAGSNSPSVYCEIYNPSTNAWALTGLMGTSRSLPVLVGLFSGKVLVTGGASFKRPSWFKVATAELYDPATGGWSPTGSMSAGRYLFGLTVLNNGRALAVGGVINGGTTLATAELYTP
ncbi:MAG: kelch repeat-containing protein [Bryobacteraceae bacterium]